MVSRPAERFIGDPSPAGIAIDPAAFRVGPPIAGFLGRARLPDVTVVRRFAPGAVRFEFSIKHSVSSRGSRLAAFLGLLANDGRGLGDRRFFGGCCGRSAFAIGQRLLTRFEIRLVLREALLLVLQPFRGETFLDLPLDLDPLLLFGLLLLARNKKRQRSDERQNGKLLHGVVRQGGFLVIRTKAPPGP